MHQYKLLFAIVLSILLSNSALAQISANADRIDSTKYTTNGIANDPIYIYYSDPRGFKTAGTLTASIPDSTNLTFTWYRYSEYSSSYGVKLKTDSTTNQSVIEDCTEGGYKVSITNSANTWDTALYAWVFQNEFNIGLISVYNSTCEQMELRSTINYDEEFIYHDRVSNERLTYYNGKKNQLKYEWESTPKGTSIPSVANPSFEAPTEPTIYRLTVSNSFGESRTKKIEIEEGDHNGDGNIYLKAVRANFVAQRAYIPANETDSSGQAPLTVHFSDSSKNATEWCWYFYKQIDRRKSVADSLLMDTITTQFLVDSITYTMPNFKYGYDVALSVKGPIYMQDGIEKQCTDRLLKEEYINVDSSFIAQKTDIPNAFTPGGANPRFVFQDESMPRSIRSFKVRIYNRWGLKVYSYEDDNGSWDGWDGETIGFGSAPAGVYYYTIVAEGWNNETFRRNGYVHLFRAK